MKFKELEFKYYADDIGLDQFETLINNIGKHRKKMMVSSYDDYFVNKSNDFIRYRFTDNHGELTVKRKTIDKNNNERIEVNLPTGGDNLRAVEEFCGLLGYDHNFGIYKTCRIYWVDKVVLVWYVVYDKQMKELKRFIEIEADEDLEWDSEELAWQEVTRYEKLFEPLGITPRNRVRKSLFELFVRD
jgi:adenylate cyclase class IV